MDAIQILTIILTVLVIAALWQRVVDKEQPGPDTFLFWLTIVFFASILVAFARVLELL